MSDIIISKVQHYLAQLQHGNGTRIEYPTINSYTNKISSALRRHLNPDEERKFRLRISNIGRPSCILQSEKLKRKADPTLYNARFRNLFGDLIESAAIAIMRQAGVNIVKEQHQVTLNIAGVDVDGTIDLTIAEPEEKLYDVKSSSGYMYRNHYSNGNLADLWHEGDDFGYVTQVYCYSQALAVPVGGLIVINKEDGQWILVPPPIDDTGLRLECLRRAASNVKLLTSDAGFAKGFKEQDELWRKKPTGNKILPITCSMCNYRAACWPEAKFMAAPMSKGVSPRKYWFTEVHEE